MESESPFVVQTIWLLLFWDAKGAVEDVKALIKELGDVFISFLKRSTVSVAGLTEWGNLLHS